MKDFVPTARRRRGSGPRTKKARRRAEAKSVTLPERRPTAKQLRREQRLAEPVVVW